MEDQILVKVEISDEFHTDLERKCEWCSELIPKETNIQGNFLITRIFNIQVDFMLTSTKGNLDCLSSFVK